MSYNLRDKLVIAISSRALFSLEEENEIFKKNGLEEYSKYQTEHEDIILEKGTAFPLIEALLNLNTRFEVPIVEVIIVSRNNPETALRIFNSIDLYNLPIIRGAFTGGENISNYLEAFDVDLFLSKNEADVQLAIDKGFAAALIYKIPPDFSPSQKDIRIAFDADAVIFSEESEKVYKTQGLAAFLEHEKKNARKALPEGPFGKLLKTLSKIREKDESLLKIAIVTARNSPAHKRVLITLRQWGVKVDAAFFLGGIKKDKVLKAFNAHIFFDDQDSHVSPASTQIPSGRVPYKTDLELKKM